MFFDFPKIGQIGFQDPASPIAEGIIDLHHNIFFYLLLISVLVIYVLCKLLQRFSFTWSKPDNKNINFRDNYSLLNNLNHGTLLEIIWTITPSIILMMIAVPSFALLYAVDEVIDPALSVKVIGNQWYWSYEFSDYVREKEIAFDSYMLPLSDLQPGALRLLEVDNMLCLPTNTHIRIIVTASDVLHAFAVPSLGVKVDAVPGRLNQVSLFIKRPGTFYGQCSELCGVNHAFMPIAIKAVELDAFFDYIKSV